MYKAQKISNIQTEWSKGVHTTKREIKLADFQNDQFSQLHGIQLVQVYSKNLKLKSRS